MFTKKRWLGSAHAYRTEIDWGAVGGAVFVLFVILVALSAIGG